MRIEGEREGHFNPIANVTLSDSEAEVPGWIKYGADEIEAQSNRRANRGFEPCGSLGLIGSYTRITTRVVPFQTGAWSFAEILCRWFFVAGTFNVRMFS